MFLCHHNRVEHDTPFSAAQYNPANTRGNQQLFVRKDYRDSQVSLISSALWSFKKKKNYHLQTVKFIGTHLFVRDKSAMITETFYGKLTNENQA